MTGIDSIPSASSCELTGGHRGGEEACHRLTPWAQREACSLSAVSCEVDGDGDVTASWLGHGSLQIPGGGYCPGKGYVIVCKTRYHLPATHPPKALINWHFQLTRLFFSMLCLQEGSSHLLCALSSPVGTQRTTCRCRDHLLRSVSSQHPRLGS